MSDETLRVFIVDDEAPARLRLKALLADIAGSLPNRISGEAADGREAIERLQETPADVVLIDIRMPRMDGIELARHLAHLSPAPAIVFVTAYDRYAVTAFELNAADYLLKPVRAARLEAALRKAAAAPPPAEDALRRLSGEARRHLASTEHGRLLLVPVADILYLKAELKYVTARTRSREFILDDALTRLEEEFAGRFIRIHRNCLVARDAIAGFERAEDGGAESHWRLLLHGLDEKLAVSRRQWPAVKDVIQRAARETGRG
ncbi:MAG: LytTR family DNA-binding domain-containing protein [Rhodocyclaceae bacterium]